MWTLPSFLLKRTKTQYHTFFSRINVEEIQDMQIGYRDAVRNRRGGNVSSESLMLTKGENMITEVYRSRGGSSYCGFRCTPQTTIRGATPTSVHLKPQ
jgi:membrane protease subunit HflK